VDQISNEPGIRGGGATEHNPKNPRPRKEVSGKIVTSSNLMGPFPVGPFALISYLISCGIPVSACPWADHLHPLFQRRKIAADVTGGEGNQILLPRPCTTSRRGASPAPKANILNLPGPRVGRHTQMQRPGRDIKNTSPHSSSARSPSGP